MLPRYIEREEKFPYVLSLHGNKLRSHANLLLDHPAIPPEPVLRETPVPGRPSRCALASFS